MVCDAMDTAEEVAVRDADDKEATAELAACNAKESSPEEAAEEAGHTEEAAEEAAARWAPWASEPLSKGLMAL